MQIITAREYRNHMKKYHDMAATEPVIVARRNARPIYISVLDDTEPIMTDHSKRICQALDEVKLMRGGKLKEISIEELLNEL